MAIKRYYATKDNTITNAFKSNLQTRGVSGNMGQSDILEVFSIYGQVSSSTGLSSELARVLIQFDTNTINTDRTAGTIPASGNVNFFLTMYDAEHTQTTPKNYTLVVSAISQSWDEGLGLDMEEYSDLDASNWLSASDGTKWVDYADVAQSGGSYKTGSDAAPIEYLFTQSFDTGFENLEIDVSHLVEDWISGDLSNYGFGVRLTGSDETATDSYYTKMFFARGSQFPAVGTDDMLVSIYSGTTGPTGDKLYNPVGGGVVATGDVNITASHVETGIYSCSFAYVSSSITSIYDVWHSGGIEYHTGTAVSVQTFDSQDYNFDQRYVSKVTNMRATYNRGEKVRFRLYTRQKDWSPTIYTVASNAIETSIIDNTYYRFSRVSDNLEVIPFGTGSLNHTRLSYDTSGSYFDLEMDLFDTDTVYELSFAYLINGSYVEQPERFRLSLLSM
jgi:hypothetical protein